MATRRTTHFLFAIPWLLAAPGCTTADADTATDVTYVPNEWGFEIRVPDPDVLTCSGYFSSGRYGDEDRICSFTYDGVSAVVYARSTPVRCDPGGAVPPEYVTSAQISSDGTVTPLEGATYCYGSNHFNDFLEFDYDRWHFRFYHSSLGYLWRRCQPMDCLQVSDREGTPVEDGCTCDRTLPAICVEVQPDGTWAELVDTFEVCPGDTVCG